MRLRLPTVLRPYAGGREALEIAAPTVGAAFDTLFRDHPTLRERIVDESGTVRPYLVLFRNGELLPRDGLLEADLEPDDQLEIVAAAEGG